MGIIEFTGINRECLHHPTNPYQELEWTEVASPLQVYKLPENQRFLLDTDQKLFCTEIPARVCERGASSSFMLESTLPGDFLNFREGVLLHQVRTSCKTLIFHRNENTTADQLRNAASFVRGIGFKVDFEVYTSDLDDENDTGLAERVRQILNSDYNVLIFNENLYQIIQHCIDFKLIELKLQSYQDFCLKYDPQNELSPLKKVIYEFLFENSQNGSNLFRRLSYFTSDELCRGARAEWFREAFKEELKLFTPADQDIAIELEDATLRVKALIEKISQHSKLERVVVVVRELSAHANFPGVDDNSECAKILLETLSELGIECVIVEDEVSLASFIDENFTAGSTPPETLFIMDRHAFSSLKNKTKNYESYWGSKINQFEPDVLQIISKLRDHSGVLVLPVDNETCTASFAKLLRKFNFLTPLHSKFLFPTESIVDGIINSGVVQVELNKRWK